MIRVFLAKFLFPSVTMLDLGIREGTAVYFLGQLGFPEAVAFNAALLVMVVNMLIPTILGTPFVSQLRLKRPHPTTPADAETPAAASLPQN